MAALPVPIVFLLLDGHPDQIVHQGKLMLLVLLPRPLLLLLLSAELPFSSSTLVIVFTSAAAAVTSVCGGLVRIFQVSARGRRGPFLVAVLRARRLAVG